MNVSMRMVNHLPCVGHGFAAWALAATLLGSIACADEAETTLEYNRDIRPILAENCFACHGPDSAARKADLRIDRRDDAVAAGAIEPGNPDESELVRRITSNDSEELMPPPTTKKTLSPEEKEILRQWIADGAAYQEHWSLIPPLRPAPPQVSNSAWPINPIDCFILARLEAVGLAPAPEADRRSLARRVSLDLTGLPPDPRLVEEFVANPAQDAYEKLVDRLLESKHWGEHRGRYWLDAARFADTHGIHFDNFREMWAYRNWVIHAFNNNMPFDQFTIEQIAGDLLSNATLEQKIASGFNRCNITTNEGGVIPEEYLVLYTRDRTETVGQVWLGMTVGCAVCHEHKFDPLSQREFYEMAAFFNNTTQGAMDGNVKDTPPVLPVPREEDGPRWESLQAEIPRARQQVDGRRETARSDFQQWLAQATVEQVAATIPADLLHLKAPLTEGQGKLVRVELEGESREVALADSAQWQEGLGASKALQPQGTAFQLSDAGDFERDQPFTCTAWVKLPANDSFGAICARMDSGSAYRGWDFVSQRRQIGMHLVHRWPDNGLKVVSKNQAPANEWVHVAVSYDGTGKAAGVKVYYNGDAQPVNVENDNLADTVRTEVPLTVGQRSAGDPLSGATVADLRIYRRALAPAEMMALARGSQFAFLVAKPPEQRTDKETGDLYEWWLGTFDSDFRSLSVALAELEKEQAEIRSRGTVAHVMQEKDEAAMAFILFRGDYDKRRDAVTPGTPAALPAMPDDLPRDRLGFAQWLLRPEHPLTARVTVNRFWQEVFGTGLVRTAGDFGVAGELPSHPELLDWLAVDFRESDWNVKRFFKQLVMSAAYRQSAAATPEKLELDPNNRLLSRGPRFRMDAEMVRDHALAASGLLVRKIGGASVKPYQPPGVWEAVAMIGSNTRDYRQDSGEDLYRRSMYTLWKRSAPPASMDIFNAPSREFCTVRRERTNTPLQALVTLNDPQFIEAARVLAERALRQGIIDDAGRVNYVMLRLAARPLTSSEQSVVSASLADLLEHYQSHPDDAKQLLAVGETKADPAIDSARLAAWTMLTNQLMNLDEVLNK
jgi:hypothetical protein